MKAGQSESHVEQSVTTSAQMYVFCWFTERPEHRVTQYRTPGRVPTSVRLQ